MKRDIITLVCIVALVFLADLAYSCPSYTKEQSNLLHAAHTFGKPHDMGETLAAIVKQESFVGGYIIRVNSGDGNYGSYGVTHINLETAAWLEGVKNSWQARAEIAPYLIVSDMYAFELALRKLETNKNLGWEDMVRSYNGNVRSKQTKKYLDSIKSHIVEFRTCKMFNKEATWQRVKG